MLGQLESQMEEGFNFGLTQETNDPLSIHPLDLERDSATTNINNWRPVTSQSEAPQSQPSLSQLPPSQSASHPRRRFNAYERPEHPARTSARIRGIEPPLVRTSVSPDRILRRRRKKRRTGWQPGVEDVIEIRSDSEEDADPSGPQNSQTSRGSWNSSATLVGNREVIDLTRSASPLPALSSRRRQSSSRRHKRRPVLPRSPTVSQSEKHPPWLRVALGRLYSDFPPVRFVIRAICHKNWEVQCQHCDPETLIGAGPGRSLGDFVAHLNATHPHLRPITNIQPQQRGIDPPISRTRNASGSRPTHDSNAQVIEGFLAKHGLSTDVAPALRAVGIIDHSRMRSLGTLPDPALDRIEQGLAKQGLDLTARILIREGLRACSRAS
ncbi:hypothetical protein C8Q74DRAFT_494545 [Fomes fomentarius]|nr:hypothetical protein C8Q74DRAFT_494545 [Fomes fomentarius]